MKCSFKATGNKNSTGREYACELPECGRVVWFPWSLSDEFVARVAAECGFGRVGPGLAERALSYAAEYAKWVLHGKPTRTEEQINANQQLCLACEFFLPSKKHPGDGSCKLCGCTLNHNQDGLNKHYMGTTQCPHPLEPRWLPIVELKS